MERDGLHRAVAWKSVRMLACQLRLVRRQRYLGNIFLLVNRLKHIIGIFKSTIQSDTNKPKLTYQ